MTQFTLKQVGDTVLDKVQQISGKITEIDHTSGTAIIKPDSPADEEFILCKINNLITVTKSEKKIESVLAQSGNKWTNKVKEFHLDFSHPVSDSPTQMELERATSRSVWTGEEALVEYVHASSVNEEEFLAAYDNLIAGLEKAKEKSLAMAYYTDGIDTIVAQVDALIDAAYFIHGSFVELGIAPDIPFDIVHSANMSKLFTDSNGNKYAKYRESDGKILKSPEFFEPEPLLKEEIIRQIGNSSIK